MLVPDEVETIAHEVRELAGAHDVVFTSGGVGPTHDDVTLEAVAMAFGVTARIDTALLNMLKAAYGDRFKDAHGRMALVPDGAELISTQEVTWPTVVMRNVWVLPGVPEVFRMKLSAVRSTLKGPREFVSEAVYTKMDEGELAPLLDGIVSAYPTVDVGSYPKWMDSRYKTKLTFDGPSQEVVDDAVASFIRSLPDGEPQDVD